MRPGDPRDMLEVALDANITYENREWFFPAYVEAAERAARLRRARRLLKLCLLAAFLLGLAVGIVIAARAGAAPRPASQLGIPVSAEGRTGAPLRSSESATREDAGKASGKPGAQLTAPSTVGASPSSALTRSGIASWYDDGPGLYAAVPGWRYGQTPYAVAVCAFADGRSRCVTVFVQDACGCPDGRVIDLSPAAFRQLAPLSAGLVRVTMERLR